MSGLASSIGLISGIDTNQIVNSLISLQRAPVARLEARMKSLQTTQTGVKTLQALVLSLTTSLQKLGEKSNVAPIRGSNTDEAQILPTTTDDVEPGTYSLQSLRTASTQQFLSKGFANATTQKVGAGTVVVSDGGQLQRPTLLDELNGGAGVRRGSIRITDRSGATADVDLTTAYSVKDVLAAINASDAVDVTASTVGGRLVLTDGTGATASDLKVVDLGGGHAAEDLGLLGTSATATLTGSEVYRVTEDFTLDRIGDGLGLRFVSGAPALRITLSDDTTLDIDLNAAANVGDVLAAINAHADNAGKVSATLVDGRIQLADQSGGGGAGTFLVEDINDSDAARTLGLDVAAVGNAIGGRRLSAGIDSVLLGNLRGGQGIDALGSLTLADRTGATATVDLSAAESLDEVLAAINAAVSGSAVKLQLSAKLDANGKGILVEDTSGATASNLVIADVGGGTLAAQLGIAVDAAQTSVASGSLDRRYVGGATTIDRYAQDGTAVSPGSFLIRDSAGNETSITISGAVKTIGDVMQRINSATGIQVTARLNDTGDGFVLVDDAAGGGTLTVESLTGDTAADLRLLGASVVGGDGKQRIASRFRTEIAVTADDTLQTLTEKLNAAGAFVTAKVIDDGSAFNSKRLALTSKQSGSAGQVVIETTVNLGLAQTVAGQDALLRVGSDPATGFLRASSSNTFDEVAPGLDVTVLKASSTPAEIKLFRDDSKVEATLQGFVDGYGKLMDQVAMLTKFDVETETRGPLQGESFVLRLTSRLEAMVTSRRPDANASIRSLSDLGIRFAAGGKLSLDTEKLSAALQQDPEGVADFFLDATNGFAQVAQEAIDSLTDPFTGALTVTDQSLQQSVDAMTLRIDELDELLVIRRDRLLRQFRNMENILAALQDQQSALGSVGSLNSKK